MHRVLVLGCVQEVATFNPLPSEHANFRIERGDELHQHRDLNTEVTGALAVLEARPDIRIVPGMVAEADSAGVLSAAGWEQLSGELLTSAEAAGPVDAALVVLHGAMAAEGELDPEGALLAGLRTRLGPDLPIVITLDLHGICTDRMLRQIDGLAAYHTYPHVDFRDTGERAARLLLRLIDGAARPVSARVVVPALVRGDELITETGYYGELIRDCKRLEAAGDALAAAILIGNPFTDVPELCTQVLITCDDAPERAEAEALRLAQSFWEGRARMQGRLVPLDEAIRAAGGLDGTAIFTDAADATSSGASGDSAVIVRALVEAGFEGRILAPLVDPQAAAAAHAAGEGAEIEVTLGGAIDPARFPPWPVRARVVGLFDGNAQLETMGTDIAAGPTALLRVGTADVVTMTRSVSLFDRAMFFHCGCEPRDYDAVIVKSPHTQPHMFTDWAAANYNIDAPGATSADLRQLGHTVCRRPMFPLDDDVPFAPSATLYRRR